MPTSQRASQLASWTILVAICVMGIKYLAWVYSGSVALYSDALESIVNVITALIAWWAIRLSHKPADEHHPFGHHKVEYFSAIIEGVLIVIAALLIFYQAWKALTISATIKAPLDGLLINTIATVINLAWARVLISFGRKQRSPALKASGRHIMSDVYTSVGVLAGLVLVIFTGWTILDSLMAFFVGANILREGWKVVSSSIDGLMDSAVSKKDSELIKKTILSKAYGAIEVHDIRTRISGPTSFIEFHLIVDGNMTVAKSHEICDRIEQGLRDALEGVVVTIHVEPTHEQKHEGLKLVP